MAVEVDHDPTQVATDCPKGSLIICDCNWYRKVDDGATTNVEPAGQFGNCYKYAESLSRSTTTSTSWQTKLTLVTGTLTGKYLVFFHCAVDHSTVADDVQARFRETVAGVNIGPEYSMEMKEDWDIRPVDGFAPIDFSNESKTFAIQYRQQRGGTAGIQDARIVMWKVG